jgi:hypothetical protein
MLVLVAALALLSGCEGSENHHTAAEPEHAPTISDISITVLTPLVLGQQGVYEFRARFFDLDADLDGGACALDTSIGSAAVTLHASDTVSGTVICHFETTVFGQVASGVFSIADRHGHVSNGLGFTIPAERRRTL